MHFVVEFFSIVLTSLKFTRDTITPSNTKTPLTVIYYVLLDYGDCVDLQCNISGSVWNAGGRLNMNDN